MLGYSARSDSACATIAPVVKAPNIDTEVDINEFHCSLDMFTRITSIGDGQATWCYPNGRAAGVRRMLYGKGTQKANCLDHQESCR